MLQMLLLCLLLRQPYVLCSKRLNFSLLRKKKNLLKNLFRKEQPGIFKSWYFASSYQKPFPQKCQIQKHQLFNQSIYLFFRDCISVVFVCSRAPVLVPYFIPHVRPDTTSIHITHQKTQQAFPCRGIVVMWPYPKNILSIV